MKAGSYASIRAEFITAHAVIISLMKKASSVKRRLLAAIYGRKRAIFLHTQKTAGTTIIELARLHYGRDMVSHGEYIGKSRDELDDISFVSGHFGYEYVRPLINSRYSFTFLRNPVDRVLSLYFFGRHRNPAEYPIYRLCHDLSLEEFFRAGLTSPMVHQYIWNHQTWQLACGWGNPSDVPEARFSENDLLSGGISRLNRYSEQELLADAISHLDCFSHVGFTETFEQDRDIILAGLGLPVPQGKLVENSTPNRPRRYVLSASERALVTELTHIDQALYQAAWQKYHSNQKLPTAN